MEGEAISEAECARRWRPWRPDEVAVHLAGVDGWAVVGGWAIDLFLDRRTRDHADIEIAVPGERFPAVAAALAGFAWDVVGDGRLWPYPDGLDRFRQTWLRDPVTGDFLVDVFREPGTGDTWVYRRDPAITVPGREARARTAAGIPYLVPELVLLFKSPDPRPKDEADLAAVLPALGAARRGRLRGWLERTAPGHRWLDVL